MPFSLLITACLLGILSLGLLIFLLRVILSAFGFKFTLDLSELSLRRYRKTLSSASDLIARDEKGALKALRDAFFLDQVKASPRLADAVYQHNLQSLELLVAIAKRRGSRVESLSIVEELLLSRAELISELLELNESRRRVRQRQKEKGRNLPEWGQEEFRQKHTELKEKIFTNKETLRSKLRDLFKEVEEGKEEEKITYH